MIPTSRYKHGLRPAGKREKLYTKWQNIRDICNCKNNKDYARNGAVGISVYPAWDDYAVFRKWAIESGYKDGMRLVRRYHTGNYNPLNCSFKESLQKTYKYKDSEYSMNELRRLLKHTAVVPWSMVTDRIRKNWDIDTALSTSKRYNQFSDNKIVKIIQGKSGMEYTPYY